VCPWQVWNLLLIILLINLFCLLIQGDLFYLALLHGNIFLQYGSKAVYTTDKMFNNRAYQTLSVGFESTKYVEFLVNINHKMRRQNNDYKSLVTVVASRTGKIIRNG